MPRSKKVVDKVKHALERQINRMSSVIASGNKLRDFLGTSSEQDYKRETLENISSELQKVSINTLSVSTSVYEYRDLNYCCFSLVAWPAYREFTR